jgi:selenocysteine-specific elongation factor
VVFSVAVIFARRVNKISVALVKHLVIGTAGHIDHGKSALVLALTGTDPDRLQEEKARGITIDLGFAHTAEEDVVLSFVDVPGHERFVKNMLAGVGGFDLVMLHVAADESVMPQTREHFDICRLLHVPAGLVVVTKSDLVDADTLEVVRLEVQELVAGSFLDGAPILTVSARTGSGVPELRRTLARLSSVGRRDADGPPRLPVDRVFSVRGFGTVVTGTLVAGRVRQDDELVLLPSARNVKVRGLQVHGQPCGEARAGQRVAVNLSGLNVGDIDRGETLTATGAVTVTGRADAMIELLPSARPLRHGARVRFHQGTRELAGRVSLVEGPAIQPGACGCARIHFDAPAALVRGDRFILRTSSPLGTVGGGSVLDPRPPRRGVRTTAAAARFGRLAAPGVAPDVVCSMVEESDTAGLPIDQLGSRAGVPWDRVDDVAREVERSGRVVRIGNALYDAARLAAVEERLASVVQEHHGAHPLEEGIPREELRDRVLRSAAAAVFEHILQKGVAAGRIVARDRVALRGHSLALTDEETRVRDNVARVIGDAALTPPDRSDLLTRVGAKADVVDRMAALLVRQKVLARVGDLLFHDSALRDLKAQIRALKEQQVADTIDVATFKDRYHVSRKYAIPLLEFLDRERVTRRVGDVRKIL